jgi:iron complex transport system permease protein
VRQCNRRGRPIAFIGLMMPHMARWLVGQITAVLPVTLLLRPALLFADILGVLGSR